MTTAWAWMKLLDFSHETNKKDYYVDRHEWADNIRDRIKFIKQYLNLELRAYRWIQVREADAMEFEGEDEECLPKGKAHKSYIDENGVAMREYHVDRVP